MYGDGENIGVGNCSIRNFQGVLCLRKFSGSFCSIAREGDIVG